MKLLHHFYSTIGVRPSAVLEIVRVWPYVFAAMALHGLYNLGALLYAIHDT